MTMRDLRHEYEGSCFLKVTFYSCLSICPISAHVACLKLTWGQGIRQWQHFVCADGTVPHRQHCDCGHSTYHECPRD